MSTPAPRVLITADNASLRFGGEAILPLHYFRQLRARGVECWLLVHERCRAELEYSLPGLADRVVYVPETWLTRRLHRLGRRLPSHVRGVTVNPVRQLLTQRLRRQAARRVIGQHHINLVHEPTPVSPRQPSFMSGLGVPVVIGPMNGGITFPPAFRENRKRWERWMLSAIRRATEPMHYLIPGKRKAAMLLVANDRTRDALPRCTRNHPVMQLVENGVDTTTWQPPTRATPTPRDHAAFAFVGRLVDWKGVDLLLHALRRVNEHQRCVLHLFGDGPERAKLEALSRELGVEASVVFHGFVPQQDVAPMLASMDALVLPSLYECGGAVVLEAMAMKLPVVATRWGGPVDYLDADCGVLVEPTSREHLIEGFAQAMNRLAVDAGLREQMGTAGARKVADCFDWSKKAEAILGVYRQVLSTPGASKPSP